ncbi:MAG: hypothetical protein JWQ19_3901 [Subtercola sp.]|nr:hypothetical protein [Subtercola sp.]
MRSGANNRAAIVLEDGKPIADVIGVAHRRHDPEAGAQKGAAQFGNQFFAGVGFGTEAPGEIPRKARLVPRPVGQFMQGRTVEIDSVEKLLCSGMRMKSSPVW